MTPLPEILWPTQILVLGRGTQGQGVLERSELSILASCGSAKGAIAGIESGFPRKERGSQDQEVAAWVYTEPGGESKMTEIPEEIIYAS